MRKTCAEITCGQEFETNRARQKYHSRTCAKRAERRPKSSDEAAEQDTAAKAAVVAVLGPVGGDASEDTLRAVDGPITAATRKELEQAKRLETALGQAALFAAQRLDTIGLADTGAGVAAMLKAHSERLAEALKDAKSDDDPLDKIRGEAALKLIKGGRR